MTWPYKLLYNLIFGGEKFIWFQVGILHETEKAVLVWHNRKTWIAKSRIRGIRLRGNVFEIKVREWDIY